jgi:FAD/FMN-containing dehydrogenase
VTANAFSNPDLFWALRGGGGPSFGVVVSTTMRTHPNLPYTAVFFEAAANSSTAYTALLRTWLAHHNAVADAGWSGVWPFTNGTFFLTFFAQGAPPLNAAANATMEAFWAAARALPGVVVPLAMSKVYPSFQAWNEDNLVDSSRGFGFNFTQVAPGPAQIAVSSWLMPRELTSPQNARALGNILANISFGAPL